MKLLLENWRQYLNENEESEFGPDVQRIRNYYNSEKAHQNNDLSQSGLSGSEAFDLAFKLSRMEAEQSMALLDSIGYSPMTTEMVIRLVAGILEAEKADLKREWFNWFRNRGSMDPSLGQALRAARESAEAKSHDFLTAWAKKRKGDENETPT